jgi:hypothetical protein
MNGFDVSLRYDIGLPGGLTYQTEFDRIAQVTNIKDIFKHLNYFSNNDGFLSSIIFKLALYPTTDIVIQPENDETAKAIKTLFYDVFDMKTVVLNALISYYMYGNLFVSVLPARKRTFKCKECSGEFVIDDIPSIRYNKTQKFNGICPKCERKVKFDVIDVIDPSIEKMIIKIWNPIDIELNDDGFGYVEIYHTISANLKNKILQASTELVSYDPSKPPSLSPQRHIKTILKNIPLEFLEAAVNDVWVKFHPSNIFFKARPSDLNWTDQPWGMPLPRPALSDLWSYNYLKKLLNYVARERTFLRRIVFPQPSGSGDPAELINLARFKSEIQQAWKMWRFYPDILKFLPFPIGIQHIGGEELQIPIVELMDALEKRIIRVMNVPLEFAYGGAGFTWSGTSVGIRMLENLFINARYVAISLLKFILKKMQDIYGIDTKKLEVRFTDLKSADDLARTRILFELAQANRLSWSTLLREMGLNYEEEMNTLKKDAEKFAEFMVTTASAEAYAQREAQKIMGTTPLYQTMMQQIVAAGLSIPREELLALPPGLIEFLAELMQYNPAEQDLILSRMEYKFPNIIKYIRKFIERSRKKMEEQRMAPSFEEGAAEEEQLPEQKPPRREGEKRTI